MTVIEFFDESAVKNIAAAVTYSPEKIIFLGNDTARMRQALVYYRAVLRRRGIATKLCYKTVPRNEMPRILSLLSRIVEENETCLFEITGGVDLYLMAVGILAERYPDKVKCSRFDLKAQKITAITPRRTRIGNLSLSLSVEELVAIHGGHVVTDKTAEFHTFAWHFDPVLEHNVATMWQICRTDPSRWNTQIGALGHIASTYTDETALQVSVSRQDAATLLRHRSRRTALDTAFLAELARHHVIDGLHLSESTLSFSFPSHQVKRALTTAGLILELYTACRLRALQKDGVPLCSDVKVGVVMDWNTPRNTDTVRTLNEADVVAMHGAAPLFISCKNGQFDVTELYKLNTVAEQFGGTHAKKALVATSLQKLGAKADFILARAKDMGIAILSDLRQTSDATFENQLREILLA